jgi:hypothetical protein
MSDDFDERLKQAAQRHASRSDVNGRAKNAQDEQRADFLVKFKDLRRNVIKPALMNAKQLMEAPGKVQATIAKSDNGDEISLELIDGKERSVLVFVADPVLMRVRVHVTMQIKMEDLDSVSTWREAMHPGEDAPAVAHMTLEQVTADGIKHYATEFGERALS